MANANNGNQFREDEVIILEQLRDGKLVKSIHPKIGGRLRLAHEQNQQISITTEIIRYDENVAVVKSETPTYTLGDVELLVNGEKVAELEGIKSPVSTVP